VQAARAKEFPVVADRDIHDCQRKTALPIVNARNCAEKYQRREASADKILMLRHSEII
jgi:hypothetical protein